MINATPPSDPNPSVKQPDSVDTKTRVQQLRAETNELRTRLQTAAQSTIKNTSLPNTATQKGQSATGAKPIKASTEGGFSKMLLQLVQKICMYFKYDTTLSKTTLTFGADQASVDTFRSVVRNTGNLKPDCTCDLVKGKDGQYTLMTSQPSNTGETTKSHWKLSIQDGRIQLPTLFLRDVVKPEEFLVAVEQQRRFVSLQPHSSLPSNMASEAKKSLAREDLGVAPHSERLQRADKGPMLGHITKRTDTERYKD